MAATYERAELEEWDARIREKAEAFGLDCYDQEFEFCDHHEMLGYMAYSGMPSHYPHWSYGKAYEKLKTMYDHGVSGLPYEMVINSNPALAYLMRDNSLLLQILTIAHVYGHNDFFKNNFTFNSTRADFTIGAFKAHAQRVRSYVEDPGIGIDKVEAVLDAAHAVSLQCRRNLAVRKLNAEEARARVGEAAQPVHDPFRRIHRPPEPVETEAEAPGGLPVPDEDLLLFIRDHNPEFTEWERDLLTTVHEEAQYFIPQIETKIMNEGWATYWHKRILDSLELPPELHVEFLVRHNQVVRPVPGGLNPYHLGFRLWEEIYRRYDDPTAEEAVELEPNPPSAQEKLMEVRAADRDTSFLRRHLTASVVRDLNLFEYRAKGDDLEVTEVADADGWRAIKETLLHNVGMNTMPVIQVHDADYNQQRTLYLVHAHDGRDLQMEYAEKTLAYVRQLWRRDVALETTVGDKRVLLTCDDGGFSTKTLN
jgi:stage V sporulation protein R